MAGVRDSTAIQRVIAKRHGAQRAEVERALEALGAYLAVGERLSMASYQAAAMPTPSGNSAPR